MTVPTLSAAYQHCRQIAVNHYENFPVASYLLPRKLRQAVTVIYAFARTADDFADEGNYSSTIRLQLLAEYEAQLQKLASGEPVQDPVFIALGDVIEGHKLPIQLFRDLLRAFKQDITQQRYPSFVEVLEYCRYSANPVGRLLLYLYDYATPANLILSDHICTALQLINFLQDLTQDFDEHNRIYLPQDEMHLYGVSELHLKNQLNDSAMQQLIEVQIRRASALLLAGASLGNQLPGRIGLELRLIIAGASRILQKLQHNNGNVFRRPRLQKIDLAAMLWHALIKNPIVISS
ncbi:MAG: squalene synthase HpnC [Thiohalomonadales bacterium]|nr:squalene synthase HpnC [Thiohalomonadales bacterium]